MRTVILPFSLVALAASSDKVLVADQHSATRMNDETAPLTSQGFGFLSTTKRIRSKMFNLDVPKVFPDVAILLRRQWDRLEAQHE